MAEPIRVLELRCADGPGGGPEKTIVLGAAMADPARLAVTVCYIREASDPDTSIAARAREHGVDYVEVRQKNALDPRIWPQIRHLARERRIDIAHAHDYKTNAIAQWLGRTEGIVPMMTSHGWTGHSLRERWLYYPGDKFLLRFMPLTIAVSSEIRDELVRNGVRPERVRMILNGIDPGLFRRQPERVPRERQKLGLSTRDFAIGAVGRLEPQKRFDLLIQAFAALLPHHPQARLLIAGEGSSRPALEAEVARLGLGPTCQLLGHCEDIRGLYHSIDLLAQSSDYEGTPNVVLEAMAMEVPIVATDAGGTVELVEHEVHGLIVPRGNAAALTDALRAALAQPEGRVHRSRVARARVEGELSFDARQRKVETIYAELLVKSAPSRLRQI